MVTIVLLAVDSSLTGSPASLLRVQPLQCWQQQRNASYCRCYPCTNYYYPNSSDPRTVTDLQEKVPGDDSEFLMDRFEIWLEKTLADGRPFLAHLCLHSIHEPHPSMPQYYHLYQVCLTAVLYT